MVMCDPRRRAFTLVELLVVTAIIGLLISLMLPAVYGTIESGRQLTCKNHVKQLALASRTHLQVHGHFPTGGWGKRWVGDPNRGFDRDQPGGWGYNILPYLELESLHDYGKGLSEAERRAAGAEMVATPLEVFHCPSRRVAKMYPYVTSSNFYNIDRPRGSGKSDYGACGGSIAPSQQTGPKTLDDADNYDWNQDDYDGVIYQRSEVTLAMILDGASSTYLLGERFLESDQYESGDGEGDHQNLYQGFDNDGVRTAHPDYPPAQDYPNADDPKTKWLFGSPHHSHFHMALCDGSVHSIHYTIDPTAHGYLGSRNDGKVVKAPDR
jgi:prepilin-type N-terminal cleavage/methylation domain-containing protein